MAAPTIVPAATWGRRAWDSQPAAVAPSARRYFLVHYDGGHPVLREGASVPRAIDAAHHANGWSGIGYHFVVTQDGRVWEGRGWDLRGAHCPGRNTDGIGVQVAIGGSQVPTDAALRAVRALYDEACRRAGRTLDADDHGGHHPTDCAGEYLRTWVRVGMPVATLLRAQASPAPARDQEEDDMPTADEITRRILSGEPADRGGALYKVREVDDQGHEVTLAITDAMKMQGARQRRLEAKLDRLTVLVEHLTGRTG